MGRGARSGLPEGSEVGLRAESHPIAEAARNRPQVAGDQREARSVGILHDAAFGYFQLQQLRQGALLRRFDLTQVFPQSRRHVI